MSYATAPRSPAGIAVTVAVHAGLIAVALASVRIAVPPAPPPPIAIQDIPETVKPLPKRIVPQPRNQRIDPLIIAPVVDIAEPPKVDTTLTTTTTTARDPGPGPDTATEYSRIDLKPPVGETRGPSIDARYRSQFRPFYPSASQRIGEEGTVVVRVVVGVDGRVVRATVAKSSGFARLDAAAIDQALAGWRFVPALKDGVAVEAERQLPVTFRLRQAG